MTMKPVHSVRAGMTLLVSATLGTVLVLGGGFAAKGSADQPVTSPDEAHRASVMAQDHVPTLRSPLWSAAGANHNGVMRLHLDPDDYALLRNHAYIILDEFVIEPGREVQLSLESFENFTPDASIVIAGGSGQTLLSDLDLELFRGRVIGEPDSRVFLAVSPHGTQGTIRLGDAEYVIATSHRDVLQQTVIYNAATLPDDAISWRPFSCGMEELHLQTGLPLPTQGAHGAIAGSDLPCRVASIAVETDWEFTGDLFGGNTSASAVYAASLIAAVSEIFFHDFNTRLEIPFLRVWDSPDTPWNQNNAYNQFFQFQGYWLANMTHVDRHAAHFLSGRALSGAGGLAYAPGLCLGEFAFGLSAHLNGFFPYPLEDNSPQNWDLMVVAHELGHNFGAPHTHDMSPPVDGCAWGDCSVTPFGTIMSYCHTCSGGLANIVLEFHERTIDETILPFLDNDAPCDITGGAALDDAATVLQDQAVVLDVLANDYDADCQQMHLVSFDATSAEGGSIALVPASEEHALDRLHYTPPAGYYGQDTFAYEAQGKVGEVSSATVTIDVIQLRAADNPDFTKPGVMVSYYDLDNPQVLPDFDQLEPYLSEIVPLIDYPATNGEFAGSGLSDNVGAVFTGFVSVDESALYTFFTESDDGSRLYIGDTLVVDNDGLHAMHEESGIIGLEAGTHAIRVEFFEHFGAAGLIVRFQGPDLPKQVIPEDRWSHEPDIIGGDLNGDGVVDVFDLLILLGAWGECAKPQDCPADLNGDGTVDVFDLLILLSNWG